MVRLLGMIPFVNTVEPRFLHLPFVPVAALLNLFVTGVLGMIPTGSRLPAPSTSG